ncbi:MAG TPA: Gmad2 immunoglobulin-like domain-containing protein [Acidimicrobiia bacterium]|nr:Gmad2 immunoglobulin-like domain-containing protein [Acidimicrobiia bacterium]
MKKHIIFAALAVVLAACNGSGDATTTTTALETTTTTAPTTTSTSEPATTTTQPIFGDPVVVYILDPSGSNGFRQGPFLYPISVAPLGGTDEAGAALETLLEVTGFDTAIPEGSSVDSLALDGTTAVVDLSDEFASGGGSFSVLARLAQLTFTLTRLDAVDDVLLVEGSDPVTVFSAEGVVLDGPMTREDFEDFVPGILVDFPAAGDTVPSTFVISGVAAAFEGVFQLEVLEGNTVVFAPEFASTGSGVGFGSFEIEAPTDAAPGAHLTIRVWEFSAEDGSVISERFVPVTVES